MSRRGVQAGLAQPLSCRTKLAGAGLDCCEDLGERQALITQAWQALAPFPPDPTNPTILADPRLVLQRQANAQCLRLVRPSVGTEVMQVFLDNFAQTIGRNDSQRPAASPRSAHPRIMEVKP